MIVCAVKRKIKNKGNFTLHPLTIVLENNSNTLVSTTNADTMQRSHDFVHVFFVFHIHYLCFYSFEFKLAFTIVLELIY